MRLLEGEPSDLLEGGLIVLADEQVSAGGAPIYYEIRPTARRTQCATFVLRFCTTSPADGLTNEALLLVLADRLKAFQAGPHRCLENGAALDFVEYALGWLRKRAQRIRRERPANVPDLPQIQPAPPINDANKPAQPEKGQRAMDFKLGDRVTITAVGVVGQITVISDRLGGSRQYLVTYLDRQGVIHDWWCTADELSLAT